jgi:rhodanese-related sulfurtransferase
MSTILSVSFVANLREMNRLLFLMLLIPFAGFAQVSKKPRLEKLDAYAFQTKMVHMLGSVIDVRTPEEYANGTIKGAKNLNWEDKLFKENAAKLPKYMPVFMFCQGGYRSGEAAEWFMKQGFSSVIILENGYDAWKAAGLPTTEKPATESLSPGSYDPDK